MKMVTVGTNLVISKTTESDINYANATTQTIALSLMTDGTVMTIDNLCGSAVLLKGGIKMMHLEDALFTFEEGPNTDAIYSCTTNHKATTGYAQFLANYTNTKCFCALGYTRVYFNRTKIFNAPYNDGVSNIANIMTALGVTALGYKEYPSGELDGNAYKIKLPESVLDYDYNNTYFDEFGVAKLLSAKELPTNLNNGQILYDRKLNTFKVYNKSTNKKTSVNTFGKQWVCIGDSLSYAWWDVFLADMTGLIYNRITAAGGTCKEIEAVLDQLLIDDPTYFDDKEFFMHINGSHEYGGEWSYVEFLSDYDDLIAKYDANLKPGIPKILIKIHDWTNTTYNPNHLPDAPNSAGLTPALIRQAVQLTADKYGFDTVDWSLAGLVYPTDLSDIIHPYTSTGGFKLANQMFNKLITLQ
jgi:hypothetical protein